MIAVLHFLCIVFSLQRVIYCVNETDPNSCYDEPTRKFVCCAYYEELNGTCVVCDDGFDSRKGLPCVICPMNQYGYRCLQHCHCTEFQRCDNVNGCVHQDTGSTTDIISTENTLFSKVFPNDGTFTRSTSVIIVEEITTGISNMNLLIYSGTATGIIFFLFFCHLYNKYKRNRHHGPVNIHTDELAPSEPENIETNMVELNEGVYHVIDESKMSSPDQNINPYLEVIDGSSSSDSSPSVEGGASGYERPYCTLAENIADDDHEYEEGKSEIEVHQSRESNINLNLETEELNMQNIDKTLDTEVDNVRLTETSKSDCCTSSTIVLIEKDLRGCERELGTEDTSGNLIPGQTLQGTVSDT